ARDAGLDAIHELERAIENRRAEDGQVLMVMVERADRALRADAEKHPDHQERDGVDERVDEDIASEERGDQGDGGPSLAMTKELHGPTVPHAVSAFCHGSPRFRYVSSTAKNGSALLITHTRAPARWSSYPRTSSSRSGGRAMTARVPTITIGRSSSFGF